MSAFAERCESTFRPSDKELVRCTLDKGHKGEHSAYWDWENDEPYHEFDKSFDRP